MCNNRVHIIIFTYTHLPRIYKFTNCKYIQKKLTHKKPIQTFLFDMAK